MYYLLTGSGSKPRPSKTGACIYGDWKNWTRKQIEYISRGSNSAKTKDQNSNIPIKAGSSELVKQL